MRHVRSSDTSGSVRTVFSQPSRFGLRVQTRKVRVEFWSDASCGVFLLINVVTGLSWLDDDPPAVGPSSEQIKARRRARRPCAVSYKTCLRTTTKGAVKKREKKPGLKRGGRVANSNSSCDKQTKAIKRKCELCTVTAIAVGQSHAENPPPISPQPYLACDYKTAPFSSTLSFFLLPFPFFCFSQHLFFFFSLFPILPFIY